MATPGANICDEVSQFKSRLFRADLCVTAFARARAASEGGDESEVTVDPPKCTELGQSWGAMPVFIVAGDELQFPWVPQCAGRVVSDELKAAVELFLSF